MEAFVCVFRNCQVSAGPPGSSLLTELGRQEDKREGGGRGIPANVSSRDKQRKLATLFFSRSEGPDHSRLPPPPTPTTVFCKERYCGLQMLDPPVALLSHMDLQLFQHPSQSLNGFFILQLVVAFLGGRMSVCL